VSRLSRQCGILNISQPYRPASPIAEIAFAVVVTIPNDGKSPLQYRKFGKAHNPNNSDVIREVVGSDLDLKTNYPGDIFVFSSFEILSYSLAVQSERCPSSSVVRRSIVRMSLQRDSTCSACSSLLSSQLNRLYSFKNIQVLFNYSVLRKQALKGLAKPN
jgi:hypothetical protein